MAGIPVENPSANPAAFAAMRSALQRVDAPSGFGWDFGAYPIKVFKDGPRHFTTDTDFRSLVSSSIWNGPVYYVDGIDGNDANNGTSVTTPVRSLWKARTLLQQSVSPGGIILNHSNLETGQTFVGRGFDFNDTANTGGSGEGGIQPTKPFALLSWGGRSIMGSFFVVSWSYDATSKTYSVVRSNTASLIDVSSYNRWGVYKRLTKIAAGADIAATRALVAAAPGSYAQMADNTLVVRLENDVPVSETTVKVVALGVTSLLTGAVDCYSSGFSFFGSGTSNGVVDAASVASSRNLVMEDCDMSFAGADGGVSSPCFRASAMTGLAALRNCTGAASLADIFSFNESSSSVHALLVDCEGVDAGHAGASPASTSNQIFTLHKTARAITLNTRGAFSSGSCVRNIDTSQHWDLGSVYDSDRGDRRYGGNTDSCGVQINATAKYWGDAITVKGCQTSFLAGLNASLLVRDPIEMGGKRVGPVGTY